MKSYFLAFAVAGAMGFLFSSCMPPVEGCTDPTANNFYAFAEKDDGTCDYSGDITFWTDADYGCGDIEVFIDGAKVGVISNAIETGLGECKHEAAVTVTLKPGIYEVKGVDGCDAEWAQTVEVESLSCQLILFGK